MISRYFKINRIIAVGTIGILVLTVSFFTESGYFNFQTEVSAQMLSGDSSQNWRNRTEELAPQSCTLSGNLGTAPAGGSTGNLTTRLFRNGSFAASTCSSAIHPGTTGSGTFVYNVHNITNTTPTPQCMTFTLKHSSTNNIGLAAFRQSFSAADLSNPARYLGDPGVSSGSTVGEKVISFQTIVPANTSIAVLVYSIDSGIGTGAGYDLFVTSTYNTGSVCGTGSGVYPYSDTVPIPDNLPAGVDISIPVFRVGRIRDLNFQFNVGGACDATVGNVNAAVDHTFVGDLVFKLTSPKGTTVTFMNRRGGTRENICSTILNDEFSPPLLSSITSISGQVISGTYQPEPTGRFNNFRGENGDGIWTLNVSDNAGSDSGNLRRVQLSFSNFLFPSNDFDNDGRSDIAISRNNGANREWWYRKSATTDVAALVFGVPTDKIMPGDYTGDGATDVAFWRPTTGEWFILRSDDFTYYSLPFGANGDTPVPADYDGDGKFDVAVFRPAAATWYVSKSAGGTLIQAFGASADAPVPADYDGDNKADLAIYRTNGAVKEWWIQRSATNTVIAATFGATGDKAVQADYTGDGRADIAVYRPSNGNWFVLRSEDYSFYSFPFGISTDIPVPGDYDGDGKYDAAVFRPSAATWYLNRSTAGPEIIAFGANGDTPTASAYIP